MGTPQYPGGFRPGSAAYPGAPGAGNPAFPPGAAPGGYGQAPPPQGYGMPPQGYAQPPGGYGQPPGGYGVAPAGYGQAPAGYGAPPPRAGFPPQQYQQQPPPGQYQQPPPGQYQQQPPPGQYQQQYQQPPPQQYQQRPPQQQYQQPPPQQQYQQQPPPQQQYQQQQPSAQQYRQQQPPAQQYQQQQPPAQQQQQPPAQQQQQQPPPQQQQQPPPQQQQQPPAQQQQPPAQQQQPPAQQQQPPAQQQQPPAQQQAVPVAEVVEQAAKMSVAYEGQGHPTVFPAANFDPEADAETLRKAMKGMGTDEKAIIDLLCARDAKQRLKIALTFKTMYGKDLGHNLISETSGHFKDTIKSLLMDNVHFDAYTLRHAMKGVGTTEQALIEVVCTRNNAEIHAVKAAYAEMYKRDLEKDIHSDTSGHFKRLLISCVQGNRTEGEEVDLAKAEKEAQELHSAGEKKWGTDESKFNHICAMRSYPQLLATFKAYRKVASYDIVRSIEHEMSGSLKNAFKAVVMTIQNKPKYFAERLYKNMKGIGTNEDALIRIIVARSEIDMVEIKEEFFDLYRKSLAKMIKDDCGGNFKRILIALVGEG